MRDGWWPSGTGNIESHVSLGPRATPASGRLAPRSRPPTRCRVTSGARGGPVRRPREAARGRRVTDPLGARASRKINSATRSTPTRRCPRRASTKSSPTNGRAPWCSTHATTRPSPPANCPGRSPSVSKAASPSTPARSCGPTARSCSHSSVTRARGRGASRPHRLRPPHRGARRSRRGARGSAQHVHRLSRLSADVLERRIADQPDPVLIDIHDPSEVGLGGIPAPATCHPRLLDNLEN